LEPGALFVALVGERYDGPDFLREARARGAAGAVVRVGTPPVDGLATFQVDDTLAALGLLARGRRREISGPVVGVTGTNGKTATKEMLGAVLGVRWRVHATSGNLNNLVGVPLTILSAPPETEALVVEAGASVSGEIAALRDVIEPTVALVTNVDVGHTAGFGSLDGVLEEKIKLLRGAVSGVVGTEPADLAARAAAEVDRVVTAGTAAGADVRPDRWRVGEEGKGEFTFRGWSVTLPFVGRHQVDNAMLALAVAEELRIPAELSVPSLASVELPPGRCEVLRRGDLLIINDSYNANPASLTALLDTAQAIRGERPVVVILGSMLELGADSARLHDAMADRVMELEPHAVAAVGAFVAALERHRGRLGDRLLTAPDIGTLGRHVARLLTGRELVLVKASRGVELERVIPHLIPDGDLECSTTC
jgi:UDP-N-acetylmuramoyl-tripeptide--D-alanyl-D-alanine ligase